MRTLSVVAFAVIAVSATQEPLQFFIADRPVSEAVIEKDGRIFVPLDDLARALDARITKSGRRVVLDYGPDNLGGLRLDAWITKDGVTKPSQWIGKVAYSGGAGARASLQGPRASSNEPPKLILGDTRFIRDGILGHIRGEVYNPQTFPVKAVLIRYDIYDRDGKVIDSAVGYVPEIDARGTWRFDLVVLRPEQASTYTLKELKADPAG